MFEMEFGLFCYIYVLHQFFFFLVFLSCENVEIFRKSPSPPPPSPPKKKKLFDMTKGEY